MRKNFFAGMSSRGRDSLQRSLLKAKVKRLEETLREEESPSLRAELDETNKKIRILNGGPQNVGKKRPMSSADAHSRWEKENENRNSEE